jgi:hypothetical protein
MKHLARITRWYPLLAGSLLVFLLSGCATSRMIDAEVRSYTGATAAVTPASYRFERLPSQSESTLQNQLEWLAEQALEQVGLSRTDAAPRYTVQLAIRVEQYNRYPYQPNRQLGFMGSEPGMPWHISMAATLEPPWYRHVVHIVLRDASDAKVAFESSATHEGPWSDTLNLLPVLLEAALRDYPAAGSRTVHIELLYPSRK